MRKITFFFVIAHAVVARAFAGDPAAPARIAVVNLEAVYREYGVAQDGEKVLQGRISDIRAAIERKGLVRQTLIDQIQSLQTDLSKARETKDDAAVKTTSAKIEQLAAAIRDTELEAQGLGNNAELAKALQEHRDRISAAIKVAIQKVGAQKHYSMVLDSSATTAVAVPIVSVIAEAKLEDITADVVTELNTAAKNAALNPAKPTPEQLPGKQPESPIPNKS